MSMSLLDWVNLILNEEIPSGSKQELGELVRRVNNLRDNFGENDAAFIAAEKELAEFIDNMNKAGGYDALG